MSGDARFEAAWQRLRFHLSMQEGFWLALVVGRNQRARAEIRERATAWVDAAERAPAVIAPPAGGLPAVAFQLLEARDPSVVWVITDQDEDGACWEEGCGKLLLALNERREAYRKQLGAGVILEGPPKLKALLRNLAPDLFSIRACIVELEGGDRGVAPDGWQAVGGVAANRPEMYATAACRALDQANRLAGRAEEGARRSRAGALSRAVEALVAQGWVIEAGPAVEEMLELTQGLIPAAMAAAQGDTAQLRSHVVAADAKSRGTLALFGDAWAWAGEVATAEGDLLSARDAWARALAVRSGLVEGRPIDVVTEARYGDVARCHGELAELALAAGDVAEARAALTRSLSIRKALLRLSPEDPERRSDLALVHSLLGDVARAEGDLATARREVSASLDIRRALVDKHPRNSRYLRFLSVGWGRLGTLADAEGDAHQARRARESALDLARKLVDLDPGNVAWRMECSVAWSQLGDLARAEGRMEEAHEAYQRALAIRMDLASQDPDNARWQRYLSVVHGRIAELELQRGATAAAGRSASQALRVAEQLVWQDPTNASWQVGLLRSRLVAADVATARGEVQRATTLYQAAAAAAERLAATDLAEASWRPLTNRARDALGAMGGVE